MAVTVLVTGDLHLSASPRDSYRFKAMETILGLVKKHKADTLIILGDLTEQKDFHSAKLVNDVVDVIYEFSQVSEVIIPRGNHDYTRIDCPFFSFLKRIKRVRWINNVTRLGVGKANCLFLPHTRDYKKDWAKLPHLDEVDWIFAHNTFEGSTSEHGKKLSGIPTDMFEDATVFSGDVHTPQTLGPITYVGAPYSVDFGDSFDPRVLLLKYYGSQDFKVDSIPVPGPQKRLFDMTTDDIAHFTPEYNAGDIVKIRVTLKPSERDQWFAIRERVKQVFIEAGAIVHSVAPVAVARDKSTKLTRVAQAKSDELVVAEFAKAAKLPEASFKVGLEFTREA